jgi:hypothetical protein
MKNTRSPAPRFLVRGFVLLRCAALVACAALAGCVTSRPPTIAHVHIGHALTGVHITPGHKGYVLVAEQRADETLAAARTAAQATDLASLKAAVAAALAANDNEDKFGVKQSVILAANHISFAATSADASANVIAFAPQFKNDIAPVVARCDYIDLIGKDVAASTSMKEAAALAAEIQKTAEANVSGDDSAGSGVRGSNAADYGVAQLRRDLVAMIGRERPAYRTVDEWYLFNLVRLPNGIWVFDKLGRGGNIDGYK